MSPCRTRILACMQSDCWRAAKRAAAAVLAQRTEHRSGSWLYILASEQRTLASAEVKGLAAGTCGGVRGE